jgi:hypothetical protein
MAVVLLAVPCAYVAHEARIVGTRKAFPAWAVVIASSSKRPPHPENNPSALRRWLGDREYVWVAVAVAEDLPAAEAAFPEAEVVLRDAYLPLH